MDAGVHPGWIGSIGKRYAWNIRQDMRRACAFEDDFTSKAIKATIVDDDRKDVP